ncbi:Cna B-type domain-containing protein [Streptococcus merionis]|uniref:Cna B-type domain-containing protein n=1 Tax=Streptococcus merionis TaxID=400065 RepID=UPI00200A147E|nr:Cna B-type domain-containing protein [Streptococcus merionis]
MSKIQKYLLLLLTPIMIFMGLSTPQTVNADSGVELTKVITDISIWDVGNGQTLNKDGAGNYQLIKDSAYRFESQFDLSHYDGKLKDGDYFTFTIPAPITVENTNFDLKDKETDVAVGAAVVTSNGEGQGGTVKVTMKNLAEYLKKKGGNQIQGVKGTFYTEFKVTQVLDGKTLSYSESETSKEISHTISVKERGENDYTEGIKKENFAKIHGVMKEEHWDSAILNKSGEYMHKWTLRVNTNQSSYGTITLKDAVPDDSAPMQYIPEYMEVQAGYFDSSLNLRGNKILKKGEDYVVEYNSSYTQMTLKILNASARLAENGKPATYNVYYATTSPANGTNVINELSMSGDDKELTTSTERTTTKHRVTRSTKITTGGTIQLDTGYRITLYKEDAETAQMLNGAEFEITSPSGEKETVKIEKDGVAQSKVYSAEEVKKGEFTVVETKAPKGYVLDPTPFKVTVGENGIVRRVKNTKEKVSVPVTKKWEDGDNQDGKRPETVTVQLYANGKAVDGQTVTLNDANNWTAKFENLAKTDDDGKEINYTVKEVDVDGYTSEVSGDVANGYTITNTHKPEVTEISGKKTWSDNNNQDNKRPDSITVNLLANGKQVATKQVTAADEWKYSFKDLPKYDAGKEITYTIEESPVDGYTVEVKGYDISNTYAPAKVDIAGTKTWNDNNNQDGKRPDSITVNLLANGEKVASQVVTADNNWAYSFTNLDKYKDGKEIVYTVSEEPVDDYTVEVKGYNITNTYTPEVTEISVEKVWNDAGNQDGKRPQAITVQLYANGQALVGKTATLNDANAWQATFSNLPAKEAGKDIVYTVKEVDAPAGYVTTSSIAGNKVTITNTYSPAMTSISGTKTWDDGGNQDGKRPASITVNLLANGQKVQSKTVTEADGWNYSFDNLPQYANGQLITYTIEEEAVVGYTATINGANIINSYSPEKVNIAVQKNWDDADNQDGKRPDKITVELYADGTLVDSKDITPAADGTWKTDFTGLPKYKDGQEIAYTIKEVAVDGYATTIDGANGQYTITNTYTPEKVALTGQKIWNDGNNQDGKRPATITVELLADGTPTGITAEASEATNWSYTFSNLDRYKAGQEIVYTVREVVVPDGYTAAVNGMNVTNSHTPEVTEISGQKTWDDNNNQDGIRPETITVHLLANGEETGLSVTTTADKDWAYSFKDVAKYKDGKEIVYTVREDVVAGYDAKIDGLNITNTHVPEVVTLTGTKSWNDGNNQDGIRPKSITVRLFADGKDTGLSATVTKDTDWTYSFKDLPKYKDGKAIVYTIREDKVSGYDAKIDGLNITNTHTPAIVNLKGQKVWDDEDNKAGIRPKSITVRLLADGKDTGKYVVVTADSKWTYSFKNLPKYKNGKAIVYTISEDPVAGYTTKIDGMTITNTHKPDKPTPPPSEEPNKPSPKSKGGRKSALPKTGEASSWLLVLSGLGLLGVVGYFIRKGPKA